jgi:hypothetical protein
MDSSLTITGKNVTVDFGAAVHVDAAELATLDKKNQVFGCSPSLNSYRDSTIAVKDASTYLQRSAGGHIHIGFIDEEFRPDLDRLVRLLDVILGNTCVLIDRDPGNVERRKNYGRAGEHRLPSHGLEYRTLSNFWLHSYPLMSFVMGTARLAVAIAYNKEVAEKILGLVNMENIEKAINTNDFDLALENFNAIKETLETLVYDSTGYYRHPLQEEKKGFHHYFPEDPMAHWLNAANLNTGWELFADSIL